jgi:Druantia protein DruA
MKYRGRVFNETEIEFIRKNAQELGITRRELSRRFCQEFDWRKPDGSLKDMSCREALLRMHEDGLIQLQPVKHRGSPHYPIEITEATNPQTPICCPVGQLHNIHLKLVKTKNCSRLWNEYIDRYHYLGHKSLPGAQLRYFAYSDDRLLALFGFGAAAWKVAPRDNFINWSASQREKNLHLIVNNARFLILPWVQSKHLASKLLGLVIRRFADDWNDRYGYRPVLLETFVEKERFAGTCYCAANWINLGDTQGRGRRDRNGSISLPIKSVWVLPLIKQFREVLNNSTGEG